MNPLIKLVGDVQSHFSKITQNRTSSVSASSSACSSPSSGPRPKWEEIPDARSSLFQELEAMYWQGVRRELVEVIRTLRGWERDTTDLDSGLREEQEGLEICGFDAFLDQVSETSREFAVQYAREKTRRMNRTARGEFIPYEDTLQSLARKFYANEQSRALKEEIHAAANKASVLTTGNNKTRMRAKMLLQSAAWLDVDKFIEHRPPLDELGFWKRPTPPQLTLRGFDKNLQPLFQPIQCSSCSQVIRGTWFRCKVQDCTLHKRHDGKGIESVPTCICQTCQHEGRHPNTHLVKQHKQSVLRRGFHESESEMLPLISPRVSQQLCRCTTVARFDADGLPRALYPIQKTDEHRTTTKGGVSCCLLTLPRAVAEAKYQGITVLPTDEEGLSLQDQRRRRDEVARKQEEKIKKKAMRGMSPWDRRSYERNYVKNHVASETFVEEEAGQDIPFFLRKITDGYPFGNVHMAVRFGPLMVENGVEHSQGGALITSRDPPQWQLSSPGGPWPGDGESIEKCLAVSSVDRKLYQAPHRGVPRRPKRYKAALKQVVGGLFSGFSCSMLEDEVIDLVTQASSDNLDLDSPEDHPREREELWESVLGPILKKLKTLMQSRVQIMLSTLSQKLLDETIDLKWERRNNNCQNFCDNIIDQTLYRPFLAPPPPPPPPPPPLTSDHDNDNDSPIPPPQYLMSFVCRPEAYKRVRKAQTKYDVPSGLCEEYLLKFRYGLHMESDVIDSLLEYWYDWGGFGGPLYPFQDLFPWDCTEAYSRSDVVCGAGCNISKHVWSFPFDSWSVIELHLTRSKLMYQPPSSSSSAAAAAAAAAAQQWWSKNRLLILLAQTTLLEGAKAMANSTSFRKSTAWMSIKEKEEKDNDDDADVRVDRHKLGGIHRAQPFSHHYDEGKYHEYFTADWAHLCRADQIAEYETMRDVRRTLADIPQGPSSDGDTSSYSSGYYDDNLMAMGMLLGVGCGAVALFGGYFADGWDGSYTPAETMSPEDLTLEGTVDESYSGGGGGGGGYDWGGGGGDGGGGD